MKPFKGSGLVEITVCSDYRINIQPGMSR
jgi:hypothetical protein